MNIKCPQYLILTLDHVVHSRVILFKKNPQIRLPLLPPAYVFDHVIKTEVVKANLRAMTLVLEAMEHHVLPERKRGKTGSSWSKTRACKHNAQVMDNVRHWTICTKHLTRRMFVMAEHAKLLFKSKVKGQKS